MDRQNISRRYRRSPTEAMRLLPQSEDAEKGVLGSFLLDPIHIGAICSERGIYPGHFYFPRHATIFEWMQFFYDERIPFDLPIFASRLRQANALQSAGGDAFLVELFQRIPTTAMLGQYLEIVEEKYWLRQSIKFGNELIAACYEPEDGLPPIERMIQKAAIDLSTTTKKRRHDVGAIARDIFKRWKEGDTQTLFGVSTGFPKLDAEIGGFCKGDSILISGPTSSGKSAFAQSIETHFLQRGERVFDATFEMTAEQRVKRLMQMLARANLRKTMNGQAEFGKWPENAFSKAAAEIASFRHLLEIFDERGSTITDICSRARALHAQHPFSLAVLDYDELVKIESKRGQGKEEAISQISSQWKTLAGELSCPVMLLSQETTDGERVKLRWSSAKINDANIYLKITTEDGQKDVTVVKNRDGERGAVVRFAFDGPTTTFTEL